MDPSSAAPIFTCNLLALLSQSSRECSFLTWLPFTGLNSRCVAVQTCSAASLAMYFRHSLDNLSLWSVAVSPNNRQNASRLNTWPLDSFYICFVAVWSFFPFSSSVRWPLASRQAFICECLHKHFTHAPQTSPPSQSFFPTQQPQSTSSLRQSRSTLRCTLPARRVARHSR